MCMLTLFGTNSDTDFTYRDEQSALWILKEDSESYKQILGTKHVYEATPSFNCGCFLYYGEWSREDPEDNHAGRVEAAKVFQKFLLENQNNITEVVVIGDYTHWRREEFSKATLTMRDFKDDEFFLDDETIYRLDLRSN